MTVTRSLRRRVALLAALCVMATLTSLWTTTTAANAVDLRDQIPIVAGTGLELQGGRQCAVGAVLKSRNWMSFATPYRQATRYAVMAKHCVWVGAEVELWGRNVGTVTWESPTYDFALVTIRPSTAQRPVCSGASQLHHCTIPAATPRAVGRIIIDSPSGPRSVPISGIGSPTPGERFCTSGSITNVNCGFHPAGVPPTGWEAGQLAARSTNGRNVAPGDSGAPVMSIGGTLYGIVIQAGYPLHRDLLAYLSIHAIFQDLDNAYAIAPA
ncbi:hypothetical protein [Rathayibacter iranicus]|uniref:Trypsin n=1 Tax=Rathayibacter iranicus NCPPB 2253 = VKM Ac-1602 TaxID=1328868 RepID=A0ABX5LHD5_9MICO|nr:hypothetical protein [Rathayibacter iranicus]MWV29528.1 hypothetical protein [Rathayibacter iranicus NCPPB 2253 = VKM Ac-1602]PWJ66610.1 hypothetical protein B0H03_10157 [Rathayibacter iranicus NCPPB 2253 = VKM Ac-1602]